MVLRRSMVSPLLLLTLACGDDGGGGGGTEGGNTDGTDAGGDPTGGDGDGDGDTDGGGSGDTDGGGTDGGATDGGGSDGGSESGGDTSGDSGGDVPECPHDEVPGAPMTTLALVAEGFDRPVHAVGHPEQPDRLFVVEQGGRVKILEPGSTSAPAESFLEVDPKNAAGASPQDERGLLGFALHPDFPADGRVYVNYMPAEGNNRTRIEEYTVDAADPNRVDPASARIIMEIDQPAGNHNGGMIAFGPDGYLYIGMGDGGGSGDDTARSSRDDDVVHAKMMRIGVEPDGNEDNPVGCESCTALGPFDYTIPADNPFVDDPTHAPEIFAKGLRNPWRFAFDAATGDLYAGDVGQGDWEEISIIESGRDYGWNDMEGFHCFADGDCDIVNEPNAVNADGLSMPIAEYQNQGQRRAVTGGAVYHSCEVPLWDGLYFYGDYSSGEVFALGWDGSTLFQEPATAFDHDEQLFGNGWNAWGDVYFTTVELDDFGSIVDGRVYRVAPVQ